MSGTVAHPKPPTHLHYCTTAVYLGLTGCRPPARAVTGAEPDGRCQRVNIEEEAVDGVLCFLRVRVGRACARAYALSGSSSETRWMMPTPWVSSYTRIPSDRTRELRSFMRLSLGVLLQVHPAGVGMSSHGTLLRTAQPRVDLHARA